MIPCIVNPVELNKMRRACKVTGDVLKMIEEYIKPGVTTLELDTLIEKYIRDQGCTPNFKHLYGFPNSACISIDDVVVHGIPSDRRLEEGEIVSIDVGAAYGGFNGDAARTFPVGKISAEKQRLIDVTRESFFKGIAQARAGKRLGDVSHAIPDPRRRQRLFGRSRYDGSRYRSSRPRRAEYSEFRSRGKRRIASFGLHARNRTYGKYGRLSRHNRSPRRLDLPHERRKTERALRKYHTRHGERTRNINNLVQNSLQTHKKYVIIVRAVC